MSASSMTRQSLRDEVEFRLQVGPAFATRINTRLNWTLLNLAQALELSEFESSTLRTLVGSDTVSLSVNTLVRPSDFHYMLTMKNVTDPRELTPMTSHEEASRREDYVGVPSRYFLFGTSQIIIHPKPSSAQNGNTIRIRYYSTAVTMTSDSSISPLPDYLDEALMLGTVHKWFRDQNEVERAQAALRDFTIALRSTKRVNDESIAKAIRIVGAGSGG